MISKEEKIVSSQPLTLEDRRSFIKLPLEERRRRLAQQAEQMAEHYDAEPSREERAAWQSGDIAEY